MKNNLNVEDHLRIFNIDEDLAAYHHSPTNQPQYFPIQNNFSMERRFCESIGFKNLFQENSEDKTYHQFDFFQYDIEKQDQLINEQNFVQDVKQIDLYQEMPFNFFQDKNIEPYSSDKFINHENTFDSVAQFFLPSDQSQIQNKDFLSNKITESELFTNQKPPIFSYGNKSFLTSELQMNLREESKERTRSLSLACHEEIENIYKKEIKSKFVNIQGSFMPDFDSFSQFSDQENSFLPIDISKQFQSKKKISLNNSERRLMIKTIQKQKVINKRKLPRQKNSVAIIDGVKMFFCQICKEKFFKNSQALGGHVSKAHPNMSQNFNQITARRRERAPARQILKEAKLLFIQQHGIEEKPTRHKIKYLKNRILQKYLQFDPNFRLKWLKGEKWIDC